MANLSNTASANQAAFGQMGSSFTNAATELEPPAGHVIVAIQFLADTTVNSLSPENGADGICFGDATGETGKASAGGALINAGSDSNLTVFPKGLTIYGRWTGISIDADADGGVICYFG